VTPAQLRGALLGAVVAVGAVTGAISKERDLAFAFREASSATVLPAVEASAAALRARLGAGTPVFHVSSDPDWGPCGVWQRVLHPIPVVCCRAGSAESVATFRALRRRRFVLFAFGTGTPPDGLDLPRKVETLPGGTWFARVEGRP
jgi:hypothetical protein